MIYIKDNKKSNYYYYHILAPVLCKELGDVLSRTISFNPTTTLKEVQISPFFFG